MANLLGVALRSVRVGERRLVWAHSTLQAPQNFQLSSPAFDDGQAIPRRHAGKGIGDDISPALVWTDPPEGTVELVLVVQDADVPLPKPIVHALTAGIAPASGSLVESGLSIDVDVPGLKHDKTTPRLRGWAGPRPIPSHGAHHYVFQMFALDQHLDVPDNFALKSAVRGMAGHVIGRARLVGTYEVR